MPGGNTTKWLLIALIFAVVLEAVSWQHSLAFGPCLIHPQEHASASQNDNQQACPTFFNGSLILLGRADHFIEQHDKSIVAVFTVVLALSTILLWRSTDKLWQAGERQMELIADNATQQSVDTREAIEVARESMIASYKAAHAAEQSARVAGGANIIARETAERQLRAYIYLESGHFHRPDTSRLRGVVQLKNFGRSPAYAMLTGAGLEIMDRINPVFDMNFKPDARLARAIVGPGASFDVERFCPINGLDADGIATGKKAIFMWGSAEYKDAFGKRWTFVFKLIHGQRSGASNPVWTIEPYEDQEEREGDAP